MSMTTKLYENMFTTVKLAKITKAVPINSKNMKEISRKKNHKSVPVENINVFFRVDL